MAPVDPRHTTAEYWSVGGVSLSTMAWNVITFGGLGRSLPTVRGTDIQVAYIPGQVFREKFPDSRVVTLDMWIAAVDPSTGLPNSIDPGLQFSDNLRTLQRIFYTPGGQIALTRQWRYTDPPTTGIPTGVPTMVQATALCQTAGPFEPNMTGRYRCDVSIDLLFSDPYFYGQAQTGQVSLNTPSTVVNPGDDNSSYNYNTITIYGPISYPTFTNSTTNPSSWFTLNTVIAATDSVTFDVVQYSAVRTSDGANLTGTVTHSGTRRWMLYVPGQNTLTLTSNNSLDSGYAVYSYTPPYV